MHVSRTRALLATGAAVLLTAASVGVASAPAQAAKAKSTKKSAAIAWAPASSAKIHPGVMMYTDGGQCTANFVHTDRSGNVYVGYAAHCAGTGEATETNGCDSGSLPLGTKVEFVEDGAFPVGGATVGTGKLVYSSWLSMQRAGTTNQNACDYNDFALVKVDAGSKSKVNPTVPFWGGPVGINSAGTSPGDDVYSYGNSSLRADADPLSPKRGTSLGTAGGGWTHDVYTVTPGIPGDSGSAFLDADGKALGTLSTVQIAPLAGSNGVSDYSRELAFAKSHSGIAGLALANGTEPFTPLP